MAEVYARTVLWYLVFIGFAVNYMIRINLNITIVEMIANKPKININEIQSGYADDDDARYNASLIESLGDSHSSKLSRSSNSSIARAHNNITVGDNSKQYSIERHFLNWTKRPYDRQGFHWNEYQQGLVLGSFFWAHWVLQIPGGILAKKYGTKLVFGLSNGIGCWLCFLIPIASYWDYRALIWLRTLQGLITGLSWPAMHVLTAKWIPPNERSKFVTAYLGSSVGIAAFYPLFGYVLHWTSWEWVYHICGILGSMWWFAWQYYVYDSPAVHPRIKQSEVRYIEKSLGASAQDTQHGRAPWAEIMMSRSVWMNCIAQWGGIWGLFTLMTQAPTYFRVIHNWNIRATGLLSGGPHLMRISFAYGFSVLSDYLLKTERISRTNIRKLATAVCCIVNGVMVLGLAFYGHNAMAAIVFLTIATMVHGAVSSGPLASMVDIAPNYAGIVLGICGMIGVLPGFISPYVVGLLTLGNQTFESWKMVFLICACMLIVSGVLYVLFADSKLQSWNNSPDTSTDSNHKELQLLKEKEVQQSLLKAIPKTDEVKPMAS